MINMTMEQQGEEYLNRKEEGESFTDIAKKEGVSNSFITRRINKFKSSNNEEESLLNKYGFTNDQVVGGYVKADGVSFRLKKDSQKSPSEAAQVLLDALGGSTIQIKESTLEQPETDENNDLLVLSLCDLHLGKMSYDGKSQEYDTIVQEVLKSISISVDASGAKEALLILGNDVLHVDNKFNMTTAGTPQDTSMMWEQMIDNAVKLYSAVLNFLLDKEIKVNCIHTMSNHDYHSSYLVSIALKYKYPQCSWEIDTDPINHFLWGKTLISTTHGEGCKMEKLASVIPADAPELYGKAKHRYCLTGHLHHRQSKDLVGLTVRGLRSSAPLDAWHRNKFYLGVPRSFEYFVFNKEHGETSSYTFNISGNG